jgi:NAD(P)H dehydrogenase (quinone)
VGGRGCLRHSARFGNVAAQLKQFMDEAGRLWQEGKLADKVATAFTASMTTHGGQESTIIALSNTFTTGACSSFRSATRRARCSTPEATRTAPHTRVGRVEGPDDRALAVARYQGQRLARYVGVLAAAREADAFRVKRPRPERFQAAALD